MSKESQIGIRIEKAKREQWRKEAKRQGFSLSQWIERTLDEAMRRLKDARA